MPGVGRAYSELTSKRSCLHRPIQILLINLRLLQTFYSNRPKLFRVCPRGVIRWHLVFRLVKNDTQVIDGHGRKSGFVSDPEGLNSGT